MTPKDIELVQSSFAKVRPNAREAAELFHARLFEIAPATKALFKGDMAGQGAKLMSTLVVVVNGLKDIESVLPAAKKLAVKHVAYGVTPAHYGPVGEALLWALERGLGTDFTRETRDAWRAAYGALSGVMIAEAYGAPA